MLPSLTFAHIFFTPENPNSEEYASILHHLQTGNTYEGGLRLDGCFEKKRGVIRYSAAKEPRN